MQKQFKTAIFVIATMIAPIVVAGGPATGGSSEVTQIANNVQLVMQYAKQIQQYETQLKNLSSLDQWVTVDPVAALYRLANVVQGGEALGMSSARIAAKMQAAYGSDAGGNTAADYNTWMRTNKDSIRGAMNHIGVQQDDMASEADNIRMLASISQNASNSGGSVAVAQAGNQISIEMLQQMQKLRSMNMAQGQALNSHMLAAQQKEEGNVAETKKFFGSQMRQLKPM
jgi:type IV secretion system protein TrbJ